MAALLKIAAQTSLIIETNNLRGGSGGELALVESLQRLLGLLAQQTLPLAQLAEVIVTHDGLDASAVQKLAQNKPFKLRFLEIGAERGYYQAKNAGFEAALPSTQYMAFADSDCMPVTTWLAELLAPLAENPALDAVSGRTSYHDSVFGSALTTIDFKYYLRPQAQQNTRNFYANNVVFKRALFAQYAYQPLSRTYRGHCQRAGLQMDIDGVNIYFARKAHTVHRLPDSMGEVLRLRWLRGQDACSLTPFLVRRHLPASLQWFARTGPIAPLTVLLIRLGVSLKALNHQDLPTLKGFKYLGAMGLIGLVSAVDMCGALLRGLGFYTAGQEARDQVSLSYHR